MVGEMELAKMILLLLKSKAMFANTDVCEIGNENRNKKNFRVEILILNI